MQGYDEQQDTVWQAPALESEVILDMVATPDEAALLVLTSELLPDGHSLLRLRLLDAAAIRWEEVRQVLRTRSRVVQAELVAGPGTQRAFIALRSEGSGKIREYVLDQDLAAGDWIYPSPELSGEQLRGVEIAAPFLVSVVSQRDQSGGRLSVCDLEARESHQVLLPARPRDFKIWRHGGQTKALVLLEDSTLHDLFLGTRCEPQAEARGPGPPGDP